MLDMDMCFIFRDVDTGKIQIYTSGARDTPRQPFTLEKALGEIERWKEKKRIIKYYDDSDYDKLKHLKGISAKEDALEQAEDAEDVPLPHAALVDNVNQQTL